MTLICLFFFEGTFSENLLGAFFCQTVRCTYLCIFEHLKKSFRVSFQKNNHTDKNETASLSLLQSIRGHNKIQIYNRSSLRVKLWLCLMMYMISCFLHTCTFLSNRERSRLAILRGFTQIQKTCMYTFILVENGIAESLEKVIEWCLWRAQKKKKKTLQNEKTQPNTERLQVAQATENCF